MKPRTLTREDVERNNRAAFELQVNDVEDSMNAGMTADQAFGEMIRNRHMSEYADAVKRDLKKKILEEIAWRKRQTSAAAK